MSVLLSFRKMIGRLLGRAPKTLEVASIRQEYADTWTYEFRPLDRVRFRAGQYIHLVAPGEEISRPMVRHMSPASSPREELLTFTMDLTSKSPYKQKFADLKLGDRLKLFGITGAFTFRGLAPNTPVVFIAGGIGITPIRSLIREMELTGRRRPWQLIHIGRNFLYKEELEKLPQAQVRVGREGIPAALDTAVAGNPTAYWFVSGSNSFISDLSDALVSRGVDREQIRTEDFDH